MLQINYRDLTLKQYNCLQVYTQKQIVHLVQMKINSLKANLRNIVLLAKEYKEKVSNSDFEEVKRIQEEIDSDYDDEGINSFDRKFAEAVYDSTRITLKQIDYFSKKILDEFAKPDQEEFDIDKKKVEKARKNLSKEEFDVLGSLYQFQVNNHYLGVNKNGKYKEAKIKEIVPGLNKFVKKASVVSS